VLRSGTVIDWLEHQETHRNRQKNYNVQDKAKALLSSYPAASKSLPEVEESKPGSQSPLLSSFCQPLPQVKPSFGTSIHSREAEHVDSGSPCHRLDTPKTNRTASSQLRRGNACKPERRERSSIHNSLEFQLRHIPKIAFKNKKYVKKTTAARLTSDYPRTIPSKFIVIGRNPIR
jgi:hypothetical protein